MGKISRFQQKRLASSVVGTPGVDTSGQQIGASASQSLGQVASTLFQVAQERQQVVNETEAANTFSQYETAHSEAVSAIKQAHANNPQEAITAARDSAIGLAKDFGLDMNSPASRNMFQRLVNSRVRKSNQDMKNWALTQDSVNTINNYKNSFSSFSMQGSNAPDLLTLENNIQDIQTQSARLGSAVMGSKSPEFTHETIKETLTGFILNQTIADPDAAEDMLSDELFSKHLSGEEKVSLLEKVRSVGKSHREQQRIDLSVRQDEQEVKTEQDILFNSAMDVHQKTSALRLAETRGEISSEFANAAEDYLESEASVDGVTDQQKLYDLFKGNLNFSFANYSKNKGKRSSLGFLTDLRKTRLEILKAAKDGNLRPADTKSLLGMLSSEKALAHLQKAFGKVGEGSPGISTIYDDMEHAIDIFDKTYADNPQDKFLATSMFFDQMMQVVDKEERGISALSSDEVKRVAGGIKDQIFQQKRQSVLSRIERRETPTVKQPGQNVSDDSLRSMMGI